MRRALLAAALVSIVACSRSPAPDDLQHSARLALRRGQMAEARDLADRGITLTASASDSADAWAFRLLRAEIHIYASEIEAARPEVEAAMPAGAAFDALRPRQLYLAARVRVAEGRLRDALGLLERARSLDPAVEDRLEIDDLRGQLQLRLGEWTDGEATLKAVVEEGARAGDTYHQALALNDLGMGYVVRSRYDEALPWFERILAMDELQPFTLYPRALFNAGICYRRVGQFERAIAMQQQAVNTYAQSGASRDREQALGALGTTMLQQGAAREGVQLLAQAFDVARTADLQDDAAIWAGNLASASVNMEDWETARRYNEEARRIKQARQSSDLVHNLLLDAEIAAGLGHAVDSARLFGETLDADAPPDVVWEAHAGTARLALAAGDRPAANRHFQAALDTIESTRSDLLKSDYRLSFLSRLISFYQSYVDALVDQQQIGRALEIADSSRARVLAEGSGGEAPPRASADRFRQVARQSGAVLLSYWLAPERSYLWIVSSDGVELRQLPPASEIEPLVRAHQAAIASALNDPLSSADAPGARLYQLLVQPAAGAIEKDARVVIVPDGILHGLNFETLPVDGPTRHYWIEDVEVAIAPSLSTLSVDTTPRLATPTLLAVGDPVAHQPDFPALAFAAAEMTGVTASFSSGRVTRLDGERATPAAYEGTDPGNFTLVHFAAHALANVESPLDSAIILSGADSGYKLYARDVANQPLNAELVTVSGCRSAGERAYAGEGLIGFAWAFLRAGARRVVAGLWDVDDRSTATLMEGLYARLAGGERPGSALRQAKLALLRGGGTQAKPYYWGPFELFTVELASVGPAR